MLTEEDEGYLLKEEEAVKLDPWAIASAITFENSHLVGYSLFHSNPEAAVALHNELEYYIKGSLC
jgi:hypothetical protein